MRTSLGVSAGSEVVCSVLLTTAPNGAQNTEYRVISTDDQANTDLGDLVASSIELMTTQLPKEAVKPHGIAVAYRNKQQTQSIRSAVGSQRRDLQLVPETEAALAYLRHTGEVAQYSTIGLVDLGARGLTVTVLDQVDGTVLDTERTTEISGNAIDELIYRHLLSEHSDGERDVRNSKEILTARGRAAKEHLSTNEAVTIDHVAGRPLELTRDDFDALIGDLVRDATVFADGVFARSERRPEMVAVIGGGANIPLVRTGLLDALGIPVLAVNEPEAAIAKGAALIADSSVPLSYPVVSMAADAPIGTFTKVAGALIGAFVVVGLIVGYGVQALTPSDDGGRVSPAGTSNAQPTYPMVTADPTTTTRSASSEAGGSTFPPNEYPVATPSSPTYTFAQTSPVIPTTTPSPQAPESTTSTTTTPRTTAPTVRPGPNLPPIPWPEIQKWIPGATPSPDAPSETDTNSVAPSTPETTESAPTTTEKPAAVAPQQRTRQEQPYGAHTTPSSTPQAVAPQQLLPVPGTGSTGR